MISHAPHLRCREMRGSPFRYAFLAILSGSQHAMQITRMIMQKGELSFRFKPQSGEMACFVTVPEEGYVVVALLDYVLNEALSAGELTPAQLDGAKLLNLGRQQTPPDRSKTPPEGRFIYFLRLKTAAGKEIETEFEELFSYASL